MPGCIGGSLVAKSAVRSSGSTAAVAAAAVAFEGCSKGQLGKCFVWVAEVGGSQIDSILVQSGSVLTAGRTASAVAVAAIVVAAGAEGVHCTGSWLERSSSGVR